MGLLRRLSRYRVSKIDGLLVCVLMLLAFVNMFSLPNSYRNNRISPAVNNHHPRENLRIEQEEEQPPIFRARHKPVVRTPVVVRTPKSINRTLQSTKKLQDLLKGEKVTVDPALVKFILPEKVSVNDYRREECVKTFAPKYDMYGNVSLIVDASIETIQYLAVTIISALHTTTRATVRQITVLVDGTVPKTLFRRAVSLLSGIRYIDFVHHDKERGQIVMRSKGVSVSRENVLVFVESGTWLSTGWLEPLLDTLKSHPKSLVMPAYDSVLYTVPGTDSEPPPPPLQDPQYRPLMYERAPVLQWTLHTALHPAPEMPVRQRTLETPVLRHDMFAARRDHFLGALGGGFLDSAAAVIINHPGGGHVELSVRQWRCHGPIRIVRCSRVGILDSGDVSAGSLDNINYITTNWLRGLTTKISEALGHKLSIDDDTQQPPKQCEKSDSWLGKILMPVPISNPEAFTVISRGRLQAGSGDCMDVGRDGAPYLTDCKTAPPFQLMGNGFLQEAESERCMMAHQNYHSFTMCVDENPALMWLHLADSSGYIKSVGSLRCLMQMTDSKNRQLQVPVGRRCETITSENELFAKWTFI